MIFTAEHSGATLCSATHDTAKHRKIMDRSDYYYTHKIEDGRVIDVVPLTFGRARIIISASLDAWGYEDGW